MSEETLLAGRGREIERIPATMWREHLRAMASSPHRFSRLDFMTPQHRAVRAFLVVELARNGGRPVSPSRIAEHFRLPVDEVRKLLDDMEPRLFFLVRDTKGEVSWAFPVTAERTVHHLRFDSGEHAFAAWAEDAFATPFVEGRLQQRKLAVEIRTRCAQSGAELQIFVDRELKWRVGTPDTQPLIFQPSVDWATFRKPNIVDDY